MHPVPLRRNREFVLLWSGQVVSTVGTRITFIAYPLLVLAVTHSPAKAGLVGFAQTIPFPFVYLPAGALVDRWDRKRVMLAADGGRALALASIAVALLVDRITLTQIVCVAVLEGTLFVFFQLAESSALPQIVPRSQLSRAIAQNQAREQGAELAGAPIGGALFGVARLAPFLADVISYAASFVTLLFIRTRLQEERPRTETSVLTEIREGLAWYWRQPFLKAIVVLVGATNIAWGGVYLALIVRAKELGAPSSLIGAMFAFAGAGAIAGALIAPRVQRSVDARLVLTGVLWLDAAGFGVLVLLSNTVALGVTLGVLAVAGPSFNVVLNSYRYVLVPDRLLGRTGSVARLFTWGSMPLGPLVGGVLAGAIGAASTLGALAGGMVVVAASATLIPSVRHAPNLADLAPTVR